MSKFLKSAVEGKSWSVGYVKAAGRNGHFYAVEGELEQTPGGFTGFSYMWGQARTVRQVVDGKATAKAKQAAYDALVAKMQADGLIKEAA